MLDIQAPTTDHAHAAETALRELEGRETGDLVVRVGDTEVPVPPEVLPVLMEALGQLASGNGLRILALDDELTTQQAADLLHLSRPHFVRLLEQGKMPFYRVGSHRRVRLEDVLAYKAERDNRRSAALRVLAEEAQKHGLGY